MMFLVSSELTERSDTMKMYTRPIDQGQMVEVSYGYSSDGYAYRRTTDRSDGSVSWECGELDWEREPEGIDENRSPRVVGWEPCAEPQLNDAG